MAPEILEKLELKIVKAENVGDFSMRVHFQTNAGYTFELVGYPTHNCQWCAISQAESLLNRPNCSDILKNIAKTYGCKQLLFDVHNKTMYTEKLDSLFVDNIVFKQDYKSTNGSEMVMYLVRTAAIKN